MNKELAGTSLAILTAVISGIAIPVNKLFVVGLDPTVFTAVRALIIGLVFLAISLYTDRSLPRPKKKRNWKYLVAISRKSSASAKRS